MPTEDPDRRATAEALSEAILAADPSIQAETKWNSASFRTTESFATLNTRTRAGVLLVLHLGAKARPDAKVRQEIDDQDGLLQWKSPDRAVVLWRDTEEAAVKRSALVAVVRQWIQHVS